MTGWTFGLAYDDEAGQTILEDLPAGPAGEAGLVPVDGVELLFDRADGRLARVLIDTGPSDGQAAVAGPALALVRDLFGSGVGAAIEHARRGDGALASLRAGGGKLAGLSRLARLDATRVTSPVARSPWWAVEAAQLAARAGLDERAQAETRRAVAAVVSAPGLSFGRVPPAALLAAAELVQPGAPELAKKLLDRAALPAAPAQSDRAWSAEPPRVADEGGHGTSGAPGLQWWLDPQTIPPDVFRHGLWPEADLIVCRGRTGLLVEAELLPGADQAALARCRARLVDPARRQVIGLAPFRAAGGGRVRAEIPGPVPVGSVWAEVVSDADRPVLSEQLRHMRRAMRWADSALGADRQLAGRDGARPTDGRAAGKQAAGTRWARLAGLAWQRCADDWAAAGDPDRAYLAAVRGAAVVPDITVPAAPSAWAKELTARPTPLEKPFLAEATS